MQTIRKHLSSTPGTTNTIDSDSKDELDKLPKELLQCPNNSNLARILNCDLAINKLNFQYTAGNMVESKPTLYQKIWE